MTIRIVRLGTLRLPNEGLRIGTVRRPPRGVPTAEYAARNYYDVWLPILAPTPELVKLALSASTREHWDRFVKRYRREMAGTDPRTVLSTLAGLSHDSDFSVGCYCADETRCHRSVLRQLLIEHGATVA